MHPEPTIRLQPRLDRRVKSGHPWIFANEVQLTPEIKALPTGTFARFEDANGVFIGRGYFNVHSLIVGRLLSRRDSKDAVGPAFYQTHLAGADRLRARMFDRPFYRLIHAEADHLPGVIIDRYGDVMVLQINSAGAALHKDMILDALKAQFSPTGIVIHQEGAARRLEGLSDLPPETEGDVPDILTVEEGGLTFHAAPLTGQKTGWFYDQRDNRRHVAAFAKGKRVLDLYTHTGGFALYAAQAGASATLGIDSSAEALKLAEMAAATQNASQASWQKADVFDLLPELGNGQERFDIVVADPPAFIKSRKDHGVGLRGYTKLVRMCAKLVAPGGILFFASCSHHAQLDELRTVIADALLAAGRSGRILRTGFAGADHPLHPSLPESAYLKGFTIAVD